MEGVDLSTPYLFKEGTTDFKSNGLGALTGSLKAEVKEVRNGLFLLDLEYPVTGSLLSEIKNGAIISAKPNDTDADHNFEITNVNKVSTEGKVYVTAMSKTLLDLRDNLINKVALTDSTPTQAFAALKLNVVTPLNYIFSSNVETKSKILWERRSPLNAMVGQEGSLSDIWKGESKYTNTHVYYYTKRGRDKAARIESGKNLKGFKQVVSTDGLVTRILPFATITGANNEEVTLTGKIVTSPEFNKYQRKPIVAIDLSDNERIKTVADLDKVAATYFKSLNPGVDKPSVSMEVDLISLQDSPEYARFKALETINLCDTVTVTVPKFNVDVDIKVVELVFDTLRERNVKVVVGKQPTSVNNQLRQDVYNRVNQLTTTLNSVIISADGKNQINYSPNKPNEKTAVTGDLWYKDVGSDTWEMYIFDGANWTLVLGEAVFKELETNIAEAEATAKAAKDKADQGLEQANKAISDAAFARNTAETAQGVAASVNDQLPKIRDDAKAALDGFNNLTIGSRNLIPDSCPLLTPYFMANTGVNMTLTQGVAEKSWGAKDATQVVTTGGSKPVKAMINLWDWSIPGSSYAYSAWVNNTGATVITVSTDMPSTSVIVFPGESKRVVLYGANNTPKATPLRMNFEAMTGQGTDLSFIIWRPQIEVGTIVTDWKPAPEDVQVEITRLDKSISTKVSQFTFDTLNTTVTKQGTQITQNKTDIQLRATKSEVNVLTNKVALSEAAITVQNGKIENLVTKTDGQTTDITQLKLTTNGLTSTVSKVETDISNLDSSSRNLSLMSYLEASTGTLDVEDFSAIFTSQTHATQYPGVLTRVGTRGRMKPDTSYVFGFRIKRLSGELLNFGGHIGGSSSTTWIDGVKMDGNYTTGLGPQFKDNLWHTVIVQLHTPKKLEANSNLYIQGGRYNQNTPVWSIELSNVFVYESTILVKDWVPAPEDTASTVQFSSIEQTLKGIQLTVANKAEQSQVTQLANQISLKVDTTTYTSGMATKANTSQITVLQNQINLKVTQKEVDDAILEKAKMDTSRQNINDNPQWYATNTPLQTVVQYKNAVPLQIPNGTGAGALETVVPSPIAAAWMELKQRFSTRTGDSWTRMASNGSTWGAWVQVIDKDNIVSQINISPESIRIQAKFIHLSGASYIENATIKSAMIDNLVADKITTGTLNANNVNIINLNVNKLSGNTSQFVQSNWNSISSNLSVDSQGMYVSRADGSISTKFISDGIQIWGKGVWAGSLSWASNGHIILWAKRGGVLDLAYQPDANAPSTYTAALSVNGTNGIIQTTRPLQIRDTLTLHNSAGTSIMKTTVELFGTTASPVWAGGWVTQNGKAGIIMAADGNVLVKRKGGAWTII